MHLLAGDTADLDGWTSCSSGHLHRHGRPSVMTMAVDNAGQVLLVPAADEFNAWTLPTAPVVGDRRVTSVAVHAIAELLALPTAAIKLLATRYVDECDQGGLHFVTATLDRTGPTPEPVDIRATWVRGDEIDPADLDPVVAGLCDRDLPAVLWDR